MKVNKDSLFNNFPATIIENINTRCGLADKNSVDNSLFFFCTTLIKFHEDSALRENH